ncbi:ribonuclease E inhibitor RraB [Croceicoccus naphthovorans]|uniref:Uncharacterized protein n=1 Tax=Croceicoccus naphthovorans TaxID=1348774 RepID=A0A0G3XE14_9SPHN|nr:ribonuclease E inhibitor RraB [Croceicoccus naphthovorans]AKM09785.1 hypothetical protein AB433_06980 [Croceicoccus naphthovorans]MBB3990665.1 hypothetical protein [Croceicoccus naphthovorans]
MAEFDPARWNKVWEADLDVLRSLRENGDIAHIPREIDVSFRGDMETLERLAAASSQYGFDLLELKRDEDGLPWLFLVRTQKADEEAIRGLTETYLQIEDSFGVECDGWGCVGQTEE